MKRVSACLTLLCMLLSLCPAEAEAAAYSDTGPCGEDLIYTVSGGVLIVSGTGRMDDYYYAYEGGPDVPGWDPHSFTRIVVEEGVTSIGACAFSYAGDSPVTSVELPSTLECIDYGAFYGCDRLESVQLPEGLHTIGAEAFAGCTSLREMNIPEGIVLGTDFVRGTALQNPSGWAKPYIKEAYGMDLIPEICSYGFQEDVTREQIAALAVSLVGQSGCALYAELPDNPFSDTENWFVRQAAAMGIVDGVGEGRFAPKEKATREQVAAILCRAAACVEEELDLTMLDRAGVLPDIYTDKHLVSGWAESGLASLVSGGVMKGTSASTLSPQDNAALQEAVILTLRLCRLAYAVPAKSPAGTQFQLDRAQVISADYDIAQGIMAPALGRAELTEAELDALVAAYNRACETAIRYDPDMWDTVRSFSCWLTLHLADGRDLSLCHRGYGEVRVWGEGERNMILRSLELYEALSDCVYSKR